MLKYIVLVKNHQNNQISIHQIGVLLLGFSRPELLKKRIDEIHASKVENLYISIDGGSASRTEEMDKVKLYAKSKFEHLNFFSLNHHESNLGLVKHITGEISKVLNDYECVIVIEDDIKISPNFIKNMVSGLNLLEKDGVKGIVSGYSPLHLRILRNKWRASIYPYIWGWACTREVWRMYTFDLGNINIEKSLEVSLTWQSLNQIQKDKWLGLFKKVQLNPSHTWDIQLAFLSFCKGFTNLTPIYSLVGNEGFNDIRAVHTKGKKPKLVTIHNLNNSIITQRVKKFEKLFDLIDRYFMNDV